MNVLIPALAVLLAAAVAAVATLGATLMQLRSKPSRDDLRTAEREKRLAELQDDNEGYYERLRGCEDLVRELKNQLYREEIGHNIAERKLADALADLERLRGQHGQ